MAKKKIKPKRRVSILQKKAEIRSLDFKMQAQFKGQDAKFSALDSRFSNIDSHFSSIDSRFSHVDSQFLNIDSRFKSIDSRFDQMESRFDQMDSRFEKLYAEVHAIRLLVEEQNARNAIVLDGLSSLFHRQERLEEDHTDLKNTFLRLK